MLWQRKLVVLLNNKLVEHHDAKEKRKRSKPLFNDTRDSRIYNKGQHTWYITALDRFVKNTEKFAAVSQFKT